MLCGCVSQSSIRANFVRATLPYESAVLVKGAERIRRAKTDGTTGSLLGVDQLIIEHALRLHICLSDPNIPEKDKSYARKVMPIVVSYIATNNSGTGYERGKEYDLLPGDFLLPSRMKVRDVLDELIQNWRPDSQSSTFHP